ncbi:MAG: hypothetical protein U0X73_08500 [Thermoanaerobaculia bacterium]
MCELAGVCDETEVHQHSANSYLGDGDGDGDHGLVGAAGSDTTHVTLMQRMAIIVPMVNDFLDAKP